jgi:hypothetical protein
MLGFIIYFLLLVGSKSAVTEEDLIRIQTEINRNESYHKFTHGRYDQMVTANELALKGYVR